MTELVEPVGRKLAKARESRGLTIEEAAMETRIRPTQIAALEADDYSAFASNTYARGFLLIYGKFLGVEVRDVARSLESGNPISIAEYQYLNAYPEGEPERVAVSRREQPKNRRPSMAPLIVFVLMLGAGALGLHLYLQAQRLETSEPVKSASNVETVAPRTGNEPELAPATTVVTAPPPAEATTATITPNPTPQPFAASTAFDQTDRAFLGAQPSAPTTAAVTPTAGAPRFPAQEPQVLPPQPSIPVVNELVVEPLKKTWVRIRRDDPNTEPIFDDVLYPKVGALKLKGSRFYLEIREADAVTLRKNGQPLAYQPPGITVQ